MTMKPKRNVLRIIHLIGGALLGTFVYAPVKEIPGVSLTIQILVVPALAASGLWLWKPQWFRFAGSKVAMVTLLFLLSGFSASMAQDLRMGGSGGFYMGYKTMDVDGFNQFAPTGSSFGNDVIQIGGDGYFVLNNFILGGGGHYNRGDRFSSSLNGNDYTFELDGGGGFFQVGYIVFERNNLYVFPLAGLSFEAMGLTQAFAGDLTLEDPSNLNLDNSASISSFNSLIDLGIGADLFPGNKGFKIGLRLGYNIGLDREATWRHPGGEFTNNFDDNLSQDGFYARITLGGGKIVDKKSE